MKKLNPPILSLLAFLALPGTASAQLTISNVLNAANRQIGGGIAQGSLFAVLGKGVGPADIQQAAFPLPTTAGLGGVTIQVTAAGQPFDAIMVYVKPNEVGAILPSATPLGPATVTVNNNGVTAAKAITVVAAAFGIFTHTYGFGPGLAIAFNIAADGSTMPNSTTQSALAGEDVLINGTGLGAIASDETQAGVTDVPAAAIQVYVGTQPAAVVAAGRGACCDGIDPNFPVPQGIAAWDVIRFTVPAGVVGCYIPVVVQIGSAVSNLATISIDPDGAACSPPLSVLPPALAQKLSGQTGVSIGAVNLGRSTGISVVARTGVLTTTKRDTGSAAFVSYLNLPASGVTPETIYPENVCSVNGYPGANGPGSVDVNGTPVAIVPLKSVALDAGTPITIVGPGGTRSIVKRTAGAVFDYPGVTFGDTTAGNYFDPGHYTVTAAGGKDVGAFNGATDVPAAPFVWTDIPDVRTPIDRSKDLTVKWTGGIPNTQVTAVGSSLVNGVSTAFLCAASVGAGQLTIPAFVLLNLAPTGDSTVPGELTVGNRSVSLFTATGLDYGSIAFSQTYSLSLKYQ